MISKRLPDSAVPMSLLADHPNVRLVQGDVRDALVLKTLFASEKFDTVFPFAAVTSGPAREAGDPETVLQVNLLGTLATLRAAREAGDADLATPPVECAREIDARAEKRRAAELRG